ncbi:MAG: 16S rRNA (guanine(966)-N(2))-methyltransferase RsmD [Candidatus Nanopelagicaceae bacterium]|jgi:16S rRNA (guanine966-N2)-methyltransferase|nr:16S rRNA (guanine(966)-N(2))-methyltransferase RsmD [Candidatus Nanopelagicaceae bacterium]
MRIIAGLAKGRNLISPSGATRPTSDRAREALFSTLESEFGSINDLTFLDLYCGSGAVGAEALSRGAAVVYAVDNDEKATNVARQNFALLENISGIGTTSVITSSVGKFLDKTSELKFDVVFLDPPYDLPNNEIEKTLSSLVKNGFLKSSAVIAIERDSKSKRLNWPLGLKELKERKYGAATIFYAEPANEE